MAGSVEVDVKGSSAVRRGMIDAIGASHVRVRVPSDVFTPPGARLVVADATGVVLSAADDDDVRGSSSLWLGVDAAAIEAFRLRALARLRGHHLNLGAARGAYRTEIVEPGTAAFDAILRLRRDVAVLEGRVAAGTAVAALRDALDDASSHLVLRRGEALAGAVRLTTCDPADAPRGEIASLVELPGAFSSERYVEVARLVVHPSFWRSEAFPALLEACRRFAVASHAARILGDFRPALVRQYERMGARRIGVALQHPLYPGESMEVLTFGMGPALGERIRRWLSRGQAELTVDVGVAEPEAPKRAG